MTSRLKVNDADGFYIVRQTPKKSAFRCFRSWRGGWEVCRPLKGTRIYSPLYPALRLRLRAGLNWAAPTALNYPLTDSGGKCQVSFSRPRS